MIFVYEADVHCAACTQKRFGDKLDRPEQVVDNEGNPVSVILPHEEHDNTHCGTCGEPLDD